MEILKLQIEIFAVLLDDGCSCYRVETLIALEASLQVQNATFSTRVYCKVRLTPKTKQKYLATA